MDANNIPYIYIFIREDLSPAQQIIQSAHAVDLLNKDYPHDSYNYMVLIGCRNELELHEQAFELEFLNIKYSIFYEPDVDAHTAIATIPLRGDERKPLRSLRTKV